MAAFVHLSQEPRLATNSRGTNYCTLNSTTFNVVNSANLQVFTAKTYYFGQQPSSNPCKIMSMSGSSSMAQPTFILRAQCAHYNLWHHHIKSRIRALSCSMWRDSVIFNDIIEGQFLSLPSFAISSLQPCSKSDAVGKLWQTYPLSWWMIHL